MPLGLAIGLGLVEGGLRLRLSDLPGLAGLARCVPEPPCEEAKDQFATITGALGTARVPFVDMSGLWSGRPLMTVEEELGFTLPIHPNEQGHLLIADACWPVVRAEFGLETASTRFAPPDPAPGP